jgi:hypothetical protein
MFVVEALLTSANSIRNQTDMYMICLTVYPGLLI